MSFRTSRTRLVEEVVPLLTAVKFVWNGETSN